MLSRFFATADHAVERLAAWMQRMGPGGVFIWGLMAFGVYSLVECVRFVMHY
jgi:hypothetical protein